MVLYECQMMLMVMVMVMVMEGECSNDLCLPNLPLQNANYSTTCSSTTTPMNGKISKWTGIESDKSLPTALPL